MWFWRARRGAALRAVRRASALDPYKPYLRQRWDQGITKIKALHREITALGYRGSYSTTYAWLALLKLAAPPRPPAPPTPRQVTGLITRDPARLGQDEHATLAAIRARCPEIDALASHVTGFARILTGRDAGQLDAWMAAADADPGQRELHSFTNGIRKDYQAVRNALTLPWSSGRVEGLNTRTKLLERQGYGRARFPLLRKRILLTS
jgi:transposase